MKLYYEEKSNFKSTDKLTKTFTKDIAKRCFIKQADTRKSIKTLSELTPLR